MTDLDETIRAVLKAEDAETLEQYGDDAPLFETVVDLYRGRRKGINILLTLASLGLFGLLLFCGYRFFQVESTREMIMWSTGVVTLFIWLVLFKLWFWLEMVRHSVVREVKRLELQVALLNQSSKAG